MIEISPLLKTYCYHCGKELSCNDLLGKTGNIHQSCSNKRIIMLQRLKKDRWRKLMENPEIRKEIEKIDKEILNRRKK